MDYDAGNFWLLVIGFVVTLVGVVSPVAFMFGQSFSRIGRLEESARDRDEAEEQLRKMFDSKIDRVNASVERLAEVQSNATKMLAVYAERLDGYAKQLDLLREGGD